MNRKFRLIAFILALVILGGLGWQMGAYNRFTQPPSAVAVLTGWNTLWVELEPSAHQYTAPTAARALAYLGLVAYHAALPGMPGYTPILPDTVNELLPVYPDTLPFCVPAALNAIYAHGFIRTLPHSALFAYRTDSLFQRLLHTYKSHYTPTSIKHSHNYALAVAKVIWAWADTDTIGAQELGSLNQTSPDLVAPADPALWQPDPDHPVPALLPRWGQVRTFLLAPPQLLAQPPIPYSEDPTSAYYTQAVEIYTVSRPLSAEHRRIAMFWSDDIPGVTCTPASRWLSIANQLIDAQNPSLEQCMETYLRLGLALNDAMVSAWHSKYHYNLTRPKPYIRRLIDPQWQPAGESPPFPAYPSGHATLSAAATTVLTRLYGAQMAFTDRSHKGRTEFDGTPRSYGSLEEMNLENAYSRILLGVHTRNDCEEGLRLGRSVGEAAAALDLHSPAHRFTTAH